MEQFFDGYSWEQIVGLALALLGGAAGVKFNLFQWVKVTFGFEDGSANTAVMAVSVVLTALAMLVTGAVNLAGFEFALGNILELGAFVYAGSQIAYQWFKAHNPAKVASI